MRIPKRCGSHRRLLVPLVVLILISLAFVTLPLFDSNSQKPLMWHVDPAQRKLVQSYVQRVLKEKCRPKFTRKALEARLQGGSHLTQPFLWKDTPLTPDTFRYPPPFGFHGMEDKLQEVLRLLSQPPSDHADDPTQQQDRKQCHRCVVMGNGGILRGMKLGELIDRFDMVIRLNSGPLGVHTVDVGNRTSFRISYPEGSPQVWQDFDPSVVFVAVVYKAVDLAWLRAMITRQAVSLWNWLFFWQNVPDQIPVEVNRFRVLNLKLIREVALDLLHYPEPKPRLWGWDQNVPTLGVTALRLASLLCDEVSLAGFGYNLSQQEAPLHYYDNLSMAAMLQQDMHNVDRERSLLQSLVRDGSISDLTGGLHCSFCPS
ncbi:lactosylceramide alpha-2,3-sialyltransferase [Osmerus mordax]|uniref:lactosylceramide alpha-2,3-sialyltransferase n=1 Tax=Osmerus mordax TaxID=8014 RepID=UPI0035101125